MRSLLSTLPLATFLLQACGADPTPGETETSITTATPPTTMDVTTGGATGTTAAPVTTGTPDPDSTSSTGPIVPDTTTTTSPSTTTTGDDPFDTGDSADSWFETTAADECKQNIDLVFVMDVSTSMLGVLQKLENEILVVDEAVKALEGGADVQYGLVVFVDDAVIINNGAPYADVNQLKADFNYWWNFTQSNQQPSGGGFNGDWPENTLDALYMAAFAFQWRPVEDTLRLIIHTTDDTFGEQGAVQSGVTVEHTYDETVLALQERQVRVFAFADADATGGPGDNEDVSMGFFTPYAGKTPIPEATDGGAFNINLVNKGELSLSAAINQSVAESLCMQYIPQ